jgi:branched-chain amino acid transport system permease protein
MSVGAVASPLAYLQRQARWPPAEIVFWLAPLRRSGCAELSRAREPDRHHGAVRALARLIPGYAGIVSLGHAAFFGLGATRPGCSKFVGASRSVLVLAARGGLVGYAASFIISRFRHLALINHARQRSF